MTAAFRSCTRNNRFQAGSTRLIFSERGGAQMLQIPVANVAVLAATFAFDRPYTYKIPQPLADTLRPGCRVMVPFSRGNRPCEGMVLALDKAEDDPSGRLDA